MPKSSSRADPRQPDRALAADPGLPAGACAKPTTRGGVRRARICRASIKPTGAPTASPKPGLKALVRMLHDETDDSVVRVSGLQPGPMRTAIRARAYVEEAATQCPDAAAYAPACVHLLSAARARPQRGRILRPQAASHRHGNHVRRLAAVPDPGSAGQYSGVPESAQAVAARSASASCWPASC